MSETLSELTGLLAPARREGRRYLNPVPTRVGGLSLLFKVGPKFFLSGNRLPRTPLGPFHTDPAIYERAPRSGLRITWIGHATSLVEIDGTRILIDPVWEPRAAPTNWFGPKRFFRAPLRLADLPKLDAVILSHDHYDHFGTETVRTLAGLSATRDAQWIMPLGVGKLARRLGVPAARCRELNWMDDVRAGSIRITAVPARHFSGRGLFDRFHTLWASFAIAGPEHRLYYGADTGEWEGFGEIGARFGPFDLAMLGIGAADGLWADIHTDAEGAVRSFRALGSRGLLMPIHWGLFDLAFHHWRQPIEALWKMAGVRLWSPTPGVPSEVTAGEELRSEWWRSFS
ncbi:MAG TPA: MBL fold metallo-hydrolase [Bryobacteraceae bacterium]|nr:MBL fold metallo-hydrolase [Bryobacteraceae bacterium]